MDTLKYRQYSREESVVFLKTNEQFGGLSNMAGGYPLKINNIKILTTEALYQACRFPHLPEVQKIIIGQASPMTAKMKSKPYRKNSRTDWDDIRIYVMYWCLRVKLAQNWEKFGSLLLSTGDKPIVEESHRDQFWGAKPLDNNILVGSNTLGYLLTRLRKQLREAESDLYTVNPLSIPDFFLMGQQVEVIKASISTNERGEETSPFHVEASTSNMKTADLIPDDATISASLQDDRTTEALPIIEKEIELHASIPIQLSFFLS